MAAAEHIRATNCPLPHPSPTLPFVEFARRAPAFLNSPDKRCRKGACQRLENADAPYCAFVTDTRVTMIGAFGSLPGNGPPSGASSTFSIASATSMPDVTCPNTA